MTEMRELTRNAEADDLAKRITARFIRSCASSMPRRDVCRVAGQFIAMVGSADSKATWNSMTAASAG